MAAMNFTIIKHGPTIPEGVNPKFFNNVKVPPLGNWKFKTGNIAKFTNGKMRIRNESEKTWTEENSAWVEKHDVLTAYGPLYGENFERDDHVAARVFQTLKPLPRTPPPPPPPPPPAPSSPAPSPPHTPPHRTSIPTPPPPAPHRTSNPTPPPPPPPPPPHPRK